jgi:hypothetical protein
MARRHPMAGSSSHWRGLVGPHEGLSKKVRTQFKKKESSQNTRFRVTTTSIVHHSAESGSRFAGPARQSQATKFACPEKLMLPHAPKRRISHRRVLSAHRNTRHARMSSVHAKQSSAVRTRSALFCASNPTEASSTARSCRSKDSLPLRHCTH